MNTLNHNALMYDEYCPLCQWYSSQFVKWGFLNKKERISYQKCTIYKGQISCDFDTARNKIAYYSHEQSLTHYGVDAILEVLSRKQPMLKNIAKIKPLKWLITKLYDFVSYNRKVIAPSIMCSGDSCTPDKNWTYRFGFIVFSSVLVISIVGRFFLLAYPGLMRWDTPHIDAVVFPLQFLFQGVVLTILGKKIYYEYFGQLAFVSLIGAIILWILYGSFKLLMPFGLNVSALAPTGFGLTLGIMFMIHLERMKTLGFPSILSWTWLAFRLASAFIIFKFI